MKNRISMLFVLLLATLGAVAQNTLRLTDVTTNLSEAGKTVTMPVYMDNADEIVAVEFTLTMPEGSAVVTDRCALSDTRKVDHALSVAYKGENNGKYSYKVTAYSPMNKAFTGLSGKLMDLVINVPDYWHNGTTYPVQLSKVILCKAGGQNVVTASTPAGITVNSAAHSDIMVTITSVSPSAIKAGGQIAVSWLVKNQGEVDATGGWYTRVSLVDENEKQHVLSNEYTGEALAVGTTQQITRTYNLPAKLPLTGKAKVMVELVGTSTLNEDASDKVNNISSTAYVYTIEKADVKVGTTVAPSKVSVGEGEAFTLGIVLKEAMASDVDVNISCSATSRFTFSKTVTIPAGQTSATVPVTAYDDNEPAMPVRATFTVSGEGIENSSCYVSLTDNDVPALTLTLDKDRITEGGSVMATIARTTNIDKKVTIKIDDDSANGELTYGATTITLASGQESAVLAIGVKDNDEVDGSHTVHVSAAVWFASCNCGVEGGETGHVSTPLTIVDNDSPMLTVTSERASIPEGGTMQITVKRNNTASGLVNLTISTDSDNLLESYTKTLSMAADATAATINVKAKSNDTADGNRTVKVTVAADGYEAGVCSFVITDENRPDLSMGNFTVSSSAAAGATVDVSVAIANEGHGASAAPQTVEILCSDKAMYSASSVKVLATLTKAEALAAGASSVVSGKVTLPAVPGNIYLFARVVDTEGISAANNISAAMPVVLTTPFTVSVTLDKEVATAGDVITINGTTTGATTASSCANIYYIYNGEKYPLQTVTVDGEGRFAAQWAVPANMPGTYQIGGCYEGSDTPDNLATVEVIGLMAYNGEGAAVTTGSFMYLEVEQGQTANGFFRLKNPGSAAISHLKYKFVDIPEDWTVELGSKPATIDGGQTVTIQYTVRPTTVTIGKHTLRLQVASGDVQLLNLKGQVGCVKAEANLVASVNTINTTVTKGVARDYQLMLTNTGNGATGKITFNMPEWMTLANAVGSLAKGDTVVAVIRMSPEGEANTRFEGNIGVNTENGNAFSLPFNIRIVSTAEGSVKFDVCDEFTYYDEAQPRVKGASIVLRNAATGTVAAELAAGVYETTLPEGYYNFSATAPGHDKYDGSILINPGETTLRTVNLSLSDNINIDYQVVETEEEDGYEIVTTATFEAVVPVPQVTISAPGRIRCDDLAMGESMIIQVTVINQGLVTAKDLTVYMPKTVDWTWEAISPANIDLRPKESSSVFVRITRVANTDEDDCTVTFFCDYSWSCGDEPKYRTIWTTSVIKNNCKPKLPCQCKPVTPIGDDDGIVIARVKIEFDQTMTMTRQGFRGTLTVENNSDKPMENIMLMLTETAPDGSVATRHEFEVTFEEKTGFAGSLGGPWTLDAGQKGVATIKYLPTKYAAPTEAVDYIFGGDISFSTDGKERRRELAEQVMTVKPSPDLNLLYFMQRDMISDDALTKDIIEETEEGEFALLINNVGYGEAKNLKLVTAQPELVDNESGLLLDIEFTSSQLNGGEKALAFGKDIVTDFGSIAPQGHAYAQWWMTTSLLGHFIDYKVEYTHLTNSDNPDLSLIGDVSIHELIRSVEIPGTGMRGFAANDIKDEECIPDVMYLTDGTTATITAAQEAAIVKVDDNTYTMSITPSQSGWTYARVADLTKGGYTIERVVRDGIEIPLRNVWQSWAVLRDSVRPEHVDNIQILDRIERTATYTLTMKKKPTAVIELQQILIGTEDGIQPMLYVNDEDGSLIDCTGNIPVWSKENQFVDFMFNVPIKEEDEATGYNACNAFSLMIQGEKVALPHKAFIFDGEYVSIDLRTVMDNGEETGFVHLDGFYSLTINTAKLQDEEGNVGQKAKTVGWVEQTGKPVALRLAYSHENAGIVRVLGEEYLGESIGDQDENIQIPGEPFVELEGSVTYDEPQVPKGEYRYGTILTMKVTPCYGYDFNRWSQNGTILSTEDTYTYMLTAPKELKLFFTPKKFNLAVTVPNGHGAVVGGGSGLYEYGEELTLTATAAQGYVFEGWYEESEDAPSQQNVRAMRRAQAKAAGATLVSKEPTIKYTVKGNTRIYPVFTDTSVRKGDVNGDGEIDAQDAQLVVQYYNTGNVNINTSVADMNNDGEIDVQDAQLIIQIYNNN